jgi:DNA-binding response OmpR family regulator
VSPAAVDRRPRIAVVADDLMWSTRLADGLRRAGAEPLAIRAAGAVAAGVAGADGVIVDTSARAYDPLEVLRTAAAGGVPAIALAPHEAAELRRAALDAGASRVHPYRAMFERGDRVLGAWLATLGTRDAPG